jgi:hypothetical protein
MQRHGCASATRVNQTTTIPVRIMQRMSILNDTTPFVFTCSFPSPSLSSSSLLPTNIFYGRAKSGETIWRGFGRQTRRSRSSSIVDSTVKEKKSNSGRKQMDEDSSRSFAFPSFGVGLTCFGATATMEEETTSTPSSDHRERSFDECLEHFDSGMHDETCLKVVNHGLEDAREDGDRIRLKNIHKKLMAMLLRHYEVRGYRDTGDS